MLGIGDKLYQGRVLKDRNSTRSKHRELNPPLQYGQFNSQFPIPNSQFLILNS
ncbi:MAG: hypothetical protein F6K31_15140 [Symploca sp. SIO2G7]|nr:hypothetical protein [Symploca sp. SIO2G7]